MYIYTRYIILRRGEAGEGRGGILKPKTGLFFCHLVLLGLVVPNRKPTAPLTPTTTTPIAIHARTYQGNTNSSYSREQKSNARIFASALQYGALQRK